MSGGPDWARVKTVFQSALDQPDDLRASFVADACGSDSRLRNEVESLLIAHDAAGAFASTDALASLTMTPEIRTAFLDSLRSDKNPAVRLVAVDALAAAAKQSPDSRTIESLRAKAVDPQENGFVRTKAASALKAISF